jgi:biofilm PGA synthesis protein PgaD
VEKPGPGDTRIIAEPIITALDRLTVAARGQNAALTAVAWVVYLYLVRDGAAAALGVAVAVGMLEPYSPPDEICAVAQTLGRYALVAAVNAALLIAWARYNQLRFRGRERRKAPAPVTLKALSERYVRPVSDLAEWQQARVLTLHHDETGQLLRADIGAPTETAAEAV